MRKLVFCFLIFATFFCGFIWGMTIETWRENNRLLNLIEAKAKKQEQPALGQMKGDSIWTGDKWVFLDWGSRKSLGTLKEGKDSIDWNSKPRFGGESINWETRYDLLLQVKPDTIYIKIVK